MSEVHRFVVLAAVALALVAGGCRREAPARAASPPAAAPTPVAAAPVVEPAVAPAPPAAEPCSGPGYTRGPALTSLPGLPPFTVTFDCMWPTRTRLEIALARTDAAPAGRAQIEAVLHGAWRELHARLGRAFPHTVQLCLFPAGARGWGPDALGCLKQGYEPDGEEGEEDEVEMHVSAPPDPAEVARTLARAYGRGLDAAHRPRFAVDEAHHELTVTWPYRTDPLSFAEATVPLFAIAFRFYPVSTALHGLRFVGVARGRTVVDVHIPDEATFLRMNPWPMREALAHDRVPYEPASARTPQQSDALVTAYRAALARLPAGSVTLNL
jgi:hypothetical protein